MLSAIIYIKWPKQSLLFIFLVYTSEVFSFRCNRRPYGTTTLSSEPDGRFKLEVIGTEETYIPDQLYTVQITQTDGESLFTSFMISAEGDTKIDPENPRRRLNLDPGELTPQSSITAKFSDRCLNSVEEAMVSTKSSVQVYWQAPGSGNGCVFLRAMVAENDEDWFEGGTPLTVRVCEDLSQPDDVTPRLNLNCEICDEAKYELTFTGIWSRNTHPQLYPENDWVPRYSDLVGASHDINYVLWRPGSLVSDGFRDFAEHANSSNLEVEIRKQIGDGVRTIIKGKGHGYPKMSNPTYAFFRTDQTNHLFTAAIALHPSPDWFLGVTRFELCMENNTWLPARELRLYPWDAGTDNGVSYESANIVTYPQGAVTRVEQNSRDRNSPFYDIDKNDMHPFGKLNIKLIRTYHKECKTTTENPTEETSTTEQAQTETTEAPSENQPSEPDEPSRYQNTDLGSGDPRGEAPLVTDPNADEYCPLTQWLEWGPCEGICEDGRVKGYKRRVRYHLVDGVAVEKYDPYAKHAPDKEVPKFCKDHYDDFDNEECEDNCSELPLKEYNEVSVGRRIMGPIPPGHSWRAKKRHIPRH